MNRASFERAVYQKWADRFDCTIEDLHRPGTELLPDEELAGLNAIHIWTIARRAFAQVDPDILDVAQRALDGVITQPVAVTAEHMRTGPGAARIKEIEESVLRYLYPPDFQAVAPPSSLRIRQLTTADAESLAEMQAACTPLEVEFGEVSVEDEIGFGCFDGDQLAAVATGYRLTGFMDIGVLTHPAYRRRGLGSATVSALCEWCIEHALIAQYRCLVSNTGSYRIAENLGFGLTFPQQSIYLIP
ncbi:MAG: GNAT family N-acetyltransferase [Anaerolineae bacterium]